MYRSFVVSERVALFDRGLIFWVDRKVPVWAIQVSQNTPRGQAVHVTKRPYYAVGLSLYCRLCRLCACQWVTEANIPVFPPHT